MENEYSVLLELLENRAGDALRIVAQYDATDTYLLYRRQDIAEDAVRNRLEEVATQARNRPALIGSMRRNADLELYDNYVLLHWADSPNRGLLVSLEPDIARQLNGFIKDCNNALATPSKRTHEYRQPTTCSPTPPSCNRQPTVTKKYAGSTHHRTSFQGIATHGHPTPSRTFRCTQLTQHQSALIATRCTGATPRASYRFACRVPHRLTTVWQSTSGGVRV